MKAGSLGKNLLIDHDHALMMSYEKFHTRTISEIRHQWTHKYFPPVFQAPVCSRSKLRLLAVSAATVRQYIAAKKKKKKHGTYPTWKEICSEGTGKFVTIGKGVTNVTKLKELCHMYHAK